MNQVKDMSARSVDARAGYDNAIADVGGGMPSAGSKAVAVSALQYVRDALCNSAAAKAGCDAAITELNS
jgi:hypothetical protein